MSHVLRSYVAVLALDDRRRRSFLGNSEGKLDEKLEEAQAEAGESFDSQEAKAQFRQALQTVCSVLDNAGEAFQEPDGVPVHIIPPPAGGG